MFNVQRSRALVSGHLDGDAGGVVDLAVLDDQLPLLSLRHDLDSLSVRNNLNTILVPLCRSIVLLNPDLEGSGLPLHHVLALQLAGEGVLEIFHVHSPASAISADLISRLQLPPSFFIRYLGSLGLISLPLWNHFTFASGLSTLHLKFTFLFVFPFRSFKPFAIPYSGSAGSTSR